MKQTTRLLAAALALLLLFTAAPLAGFCGGRTLAADDSVYLPYYKEVISQYQTAIKHHFYRNEEVPENKTKYISQTLLDHKSYSRSNTVYYTLYDINRNGFPELIVADQDEYDCYIYGIFSYTSKLTVVADSLSLGYHSLARIFQNGTVAVFFRGGRGYYDLTFYRLNGKDRSKQKDVLAHDGMDGSTYYRGQTEISERAAKDLCKYYTGQTDPENLQSDVTLNWKRINDLSAVKGLAGPTGLKVAAQSNTTLKLQWKKVPGAAGYVVYRYDTASKKFTEIRTTGKTAVKVKDLKPGTSYRFAVRAFSRPAKKPLFSAFSKTLRVKTAK